MKITFFLACYNVKLLSISQKSSTRGHPTKIFDKWDCYTQKRPFVDNSVRDPLVDNSWRIFGSLFCTPTLPLGSKGLICAHQHEPDSGS